MLTDGEANSARARRSTYSRPSWPIPLAAGTPRITNAFAETLTSPSFSRIAAQTALARFMTVLLVGADDATAAATDAATSGSSSSSRTVAFAGRMWNIHASRPSATVSASPPSESATPAA